MDVKKTADFADIPWMAGSGNPGRSALLTAAVVSAGFIALAVIFVNSNSSARLADNARDLHWTNAALGTSALGRAAAGQVATFEDLVGTGFADKEAMAIADSELSTVTGALEDLADQAPADISPHLTEMVAVLSQRPVEFASVDAAYSRLAGALGDRMVTLEATIDDSGQQADRLGAVVRLLVTLIIPTAVILIYRRRAATQVLEAQVRLESQLEAERTISQAKDEFVAGMSHEMRTPLTGIYGFSEVILDSEPEGQVDRELVTVINTEAAELTRMVDDFIAVSRIDTEALDVQMGPVEAVPLVRSVAERYRRRGVDIHVTGTSPPVLADEGRLRQATVNLISNAVAHGGESVRVQISEAGGTTTLAVIDNGAGVDATVAERLFTRFVHQGSDVLVKGSHGLGTWVAREFARAMGGDITYSRTGDATRFAITLPTVSSEPEANPVAADAIVSAAR